MNKPVIGLLLGAALGAIDGASAWLYEIDEVRAQIASIVVGSTLKGLITGVAAGFFARKVGSVPLGIAFGLLVGLGLSYAVAAMPSESGQHYYWQIMLPGAVLGAIVGFTTQKYGRAPATA